MWVWVPRSPCVIYSCPSRQQASVQTALISPVEVLDQGRASVHEDEDSGGASCVYPSIPRTSKGGLGWYKLMPTCLVLGASRPKGGLVSVLPALHIFLLQGEGDDHALG